MVTPCTGFHPQSLCTLCSILIYTEGTDLSLGETVWSGIKALELQIGDHNFNPSMRTADVFMVVPSLCSSQASLIPILTA